MSTQKAWLTVVALALLATVLVLWLADDHQSGTFAELLEPLIMPFGILPFIAAAVLSRNPHSPGMEIFAVAMFLQFFALFSLLKFIRDRARAKDA
jgi:hypothetical protein